MWLQLLFWVHLLHSDLEPDVLLLPWQKRGLLELRLPLFLVLQQGLHGELALLRRDMFVNEVRGGHPVSWKD